MADIVIVDDELLYRHILRHILEPEGHSVRVAVDGYEVMKLINERRPDILVTYIVMPNKEGLELIVELKRQNKTIKIVAISGGTSTGSGERCYLDTALRLGADEAVRKPFSRKEIISVVNSLV